MGDIEQVQRVKEKYSIELLAKSLVNGVGVGSKIVNGEYTGEPCIRVYVTHKIVDGRVEKKHKIPEVIEGVKTDVVEGGVMEKTAASDVPRIAQSRLRPARPGCSISHYATDTRGTLGGLVADKNTDELLFLSNWHVIANYGMCRQGDPILQPGGLDGGALPDDVIGYLERWKDVQMLCPVDDRQETLPSAKKRIRKAVQHDIDLPVNYVDAAVAKPVSDDAVNVTPLGIEEGNGESDRDVEKYEKYDPPVSERGDAVTKSGATTGVTSGTVVDTDYDTLIVYPKVGVALFKNQTLLHDGSVANPLENVLPALQIDILRRVRE